jgi:hypothetical protein
VARKRTPYTIEGDVIMRNRIKKLQAMVESETERTMVQTAVDIMELSRSRVPIETGFLYRSAVIDRPSKRSGRTDVVFGYLAKYAGVVHQTYSGAKGERYYLKSAVDEIAPEMLSRIVRNNKKGFLMGIRRRG